MWLLFEECLTCRFEQNIIKLAFLNPHLTFSKDNFLKFLHNHFLQKVVIFSVSKVKRNETKNFHLSQGILLHKFLIKKKKNHPIFNRER